MRFLGIFCLSLVACGAHAADGASSENAASDVPTCNVRDHGAKGDGKTKDTAALQAAVDACAGTGGTVEVPAGTYLSGTIRLASNMTLDLQAGATILGTQVDADYPTLTPPTNNSQLSNCQKALVYAEGTHDLHIKGSGVIDGNGGLAEWNNSKEATRPMAMFVVQGNGVSIDGITVRHSAMWSVVQMETDNLAISNFTVDSQQGSTRDGIDIVDCHHVTIDHANISSEDDSICLKSGVDRGVDDVKVTNSHVHTSGVANALKIGTATYGNFTNITFDTIDVAHADKAAMAVETVDGSTIQNIVFKNITYQDVGTPLFLIVGDRGVRPATAPRRIGSIDGVTFQNVTGSGGRHNWGSVISGLEQNGTTYPISNVHFDNVHVTLQGNVGNIPAVPPEYSGEYPDPNLWGNTPASGFFFRHVNGVTFANSSFTVAGADARPLYSGVDIANIAIPTSTVTFVLHAPGFAPGTQFAITGQTEAMPGFPITDLLTGWKSGIALSSTDGRTFTATAQLPQGAQFQYKAIATTNGTTDWERQQAGNRAAVIPGQAATTIDLTWQN